MHFIHKHMFKLHSVSGRVAIGKGIGLLVGAGAMLALPAMNMPMFSMFGIGTLLMFILMGAFIGLMGLFDRHPLFKFRLPWWIRGTTIGAAFMLMYILFTYETIEAVMQSGLVSWMGLTSPFWAILDGICIGGIMGFLETKFAGEGEDLPLY